MVMAFNPNVVLWIVSVWWLFLIVTLWEAVWKGIALWKTGRNKQLAWFVCILIFNTAGILPIIYLLFFQKNRERKAHKDSRKKRK
jgi:hypothetical protein